MPGAKVSRLWFWFRTVAPLMLDLRLQFQQRVCMNVLSQLLKVCVSDFKGFKG